MSGRIIDKGGPQCLASASMQGKGPRRRKVRQGDRRRRSYRQMCFHDKGDRVNEGCRTDKGGCGYKTIASTKAAVSTKACVSIKAIVVTKAVVSTKSLSRQRRSYRRRRSYRQRRSYQHGDRIDDRSIDKGSCINNGGAQYLGSVSMRGESSPTPESAARGRLERILRPRRIGIKARRWAV